MNPISLRDFFWLIICFGESDLYVAGAGIKPTTTLPICLDLGTNTEKVHNDPLYLGLRRRRPDTPEVSLTEVSRVLAGILTKNTTDGRIYA